MNPEEGVTTSDTTTTPTEEPTTDTTVTPTTDSADYSEILEEIAVYEHNQTQILLDTFNFVHDISYVVLGAIIALVAIYAFWRKGLEW